MESFVSFVLWLLVGAGVIAAFYLWSHLSVPGRDYSDDWRAEL